nr:MAG TPA: hypothetical protein [Caudoviricetes sp.]
MRVLTLSALVRVLLFSVYMIFLNIFEAQKKRGEHLSFCYLFIYFFV